MNLSDLPLRVSTRRPFVALVERFVRKSALSQGPTSSRHVALTFDDGPHPEWTPRVLDALDVAGAKATFFVVGRSASQHGAIVRDARRRGHEIGTHLYSHDRRTVFDDRAFSEELSRSKFELESLLGEPIRWLRFPYGERGRQDPRAISEAHGLSAVHWTYSAHDGMLQEPAEIVARFRTGLRAGAIVLLHDALADEKTLPPSYVADRNATLGALPGIGASLREIGLRSVTLSELFDPAHCSGSGERGNGDSAKNSR
jgi:peptidoglycan/xylan/chitin deacetylase (PgdA/CDA1 family)